MWGVVTLKISLGTEELTRVERYRYTVSSPEKMRKEYHSDKLTLGIGHSYNCHLRFFVECLAKEFAAQFMGCMNLLHPFGPRGV